MTFNFTLKKRFMGDSKAIRLGGIASNLNRLANLSKTPGFDQHTFQAVLDETKFFTEWTAKDLKLKEQVQVLALQRTLAGLTPVDAEKKTRQWANKILSISGLMKRKK